MTLEELPYIVAHSNDGEATFSVIPAKLCWLRRICFCCTWYQHSVTVYWHKRPSGLYSCTIQVSGGYRPENYLLATPTDIQAQTVKTLVQSVLLE